MSGEFSLQAMFDAIPLKFIEELFQSEGLAPVGVAPNDSDNTAWTFRLLATAPLEAVTRITARLRAIHVLCNETGSSLILEQLATFAPSRYADGATISSPFALASWLYRTFSHHSDGLFEVCLSIAQSRTLLFSPDDRMHGPRGMALRCSTESLEDLRLALTEKFPSTASQQRWEVRHRFRKNPVTDYYLFWLADEGPGETSGGYRQGLRELLVPPTVALICYPQRGVVEVSSSANSMWTREVRRAFCRHILGWAGTPEVAVKPGNLDLLCAPSSPFALNAVDEIQSLTVSRMTLANARIAHFRVILPDESNNPEQASAGRSPWLPIRLSSAGDHFHVLDASFQARFRDPDEAGNRRVKFTVARSGATSLGGTPQHHLLKKYWRPFRPRQLERSCVPS